MANAADRVWVDSMAADYDRLLVPVVFSPFARDMARRVAAHTPRTVLEVAAGTGVLTRELPGSVTATDLNPAMVEVGRGRVPGARWEQADAQRLPFADGSFDVVVCQFGVMFFPDRPAAFAEIARVLTHGGTALVSTWAALETHDFESALVTVLRRLFPDDPPRFMDTVPHGYADPALLAADARAGGLARADVTTVTVTGHAPSAAGLATGYCTGTPIRAELLARGDLATATAAVVREMTALLGDGPVEGSMSAHVLEAART